MAAQTPLTGRISRVEICDPSTEVPYDESNPLPVTLTASPTIDIGQVDQGTAGTDPWLIKISQTGTNNDVDATITNATLAVTQSGTWNIATLTSITNAVHIDDNAGSLTVDNSGTFAVQAAQSGTWNITNISGTVSLPTGAATSALQTQPGVDIGDVTINNASGVSAVNIQDGGNSITVDQPTGTNLHVVTDSGTITTVSTVTNLSQQGGVAISLNTGVRDTGTQRVTIATNDVVPITDNSGSLTVDQPTGSNLHVVTDSGTITTVSTVTNLSQQGGVAISLNTGVRDTGTQRVTIATNDVVPVTDNSGSLTVDNGGTFAVQAAQSGTWTVQPGNTANTTAWKVDGSAVTQPVSGTVTATQATGTNLHAVIDSGTVSTITNVVHVDDNSGSLTVDGTVTAVDSTASSATGTNVSSSATSVQLLAANAARKMATFFNDSTQIVYVKLGTTASATDYMFQLFSKGFYELPHPMYTGRIDAIWASANGTMRIVEY